MPYPRPNRLPGPTPDGTGFIIGSSPSVLPPKPGADSNALDLRPWPKPPSRRWASVAPGYARYPNVNTTHIIIPDRPSEHITGLSISMSVGVEGPGDVREDLISPPASAEATQTPI